MAARSARGGVVAALIVGYLGLITLGAYVVGGSVIDAMRSQQTADVMAAVPQQEIATVAVAQERALATVVDEACTPARPDCAGARMALLDGIPELDQDGRPVLSEAGDVSFAQPSARQQSATTLDQRDQAFRVVDVRMLDLQVRDSIARTLDDRAAIDQVHKTAEEAPEQALAAYEQILQNATGVSRSLARTTDGELGAHVQAELLLHEALLTAFQERPLVSLAFRATANERAASVEAATTQVAAVDEQLVAAQAALDRIGSSHAAPPIDGEYALVRSAVTSDKLGTLTSEQAQGFAYESATWFQEMASVRDAVRADALDLAGEQASVAINRALLTGVITGVVLLLGLGTVVVLSVLLLRRPRTPRVPPTATPVPTAG